MDEYCLGTAQRCADVVLALDVRINVVGDDVKNKPDVFVDSPSQKRNSFGVHGEGFDH